MTCDYILCSFDAVTRPLARQLRDAWQNTEMTLKDLRALAGLEMSLVSLGRKLSGKQVMTTDECETLAGALGVNLVWAPEEIAVPSGAPSASRNQRRKRAA